MKTSSTLATIYFHPACSVARTLKICQQVNQPAQIKNIRDIKIARVKKKHSSGAYSPEPPTAA